VLRFFTNPHKPMILALSRPDPKKNVTTLLKAYGESRHLRELANLTLILGNRDDIEEMSGGAATVLTAVLKLIDRRQIRPLRPGRLPQAPQADRRAAHLPTRRQDQGAPSLFFLFFFLKVHKTHTQFRTCSNLQTNFLEYWQGVFINPALVEPFGLTLIEVINNPSLNMHVRFQVQKFDLTVFC